MDEQLRKAALEYHRAPAPGKIAVVATKGLVNQSDLALAYTPGVAFACEAIAADEGEARNLTARGNLVAVITNGTAVARPAPVGRPVVIEARIGRLGLRLKRDKDFDLVDPNNDPLPHFLFPISS